MAPLKAPGPDGMPPLFYQHYWGTIGNDITKSVLHFLNFAYLPNNPPNMLQILDPLAFVMFYTKYFQRSWLIESRKSSQRSSLNIKVLLQKAD